MDWPDVLTLVSVSLGALFFAAGLIGMIRFPNALSRLHALSKVDNVGLGLVIIGLLPQASWPYGMLKLTALWLVVLIAGGAVGQMLAGAIHAEAIGMRDGTGQWAGRDHRPRRRG
jgi:multicomponent Na+:H+ antiporter subunit G